MCVHTHSHALFRETATDTLYQSARIMHDTAHVFCSFLPRRATPAHNSDLASVTAYVIALVRLEGPMRPSRT